jgi:hypothetical protein
MDLSTREYPRWVFSPNYADRVVASPDLDPVVQGEAGWYDTPADFPQDSAETAAEECPYCKVYQNRITELETQIVEMEKAKEQ